jgi:hypothetical protein
MLYRIVWKMLTDVSEELTASIIRVEAVSSSETSINMYQTTRCNVPEDSHLHTRRSENLRSHPFQVKAIDFYDIFILYHVTILYNELF